MEYPTDFNPVPELVTEELATLESIGTVIRFLAGSMLMEEGESTSHVLLLRSGHVKIVKPESGHTMSLRGPGEIVGEMAVYLNEPRSASVYAVGEVTARHIPSRDWVQFLREHPRAVFAQTRSLALRLTENNDKRVEAFLGAEQKLAKALLELISKGVGDAEAGAVALRFNQRELADLAGVSRESVVQVIRGFKAAEIVSTGRLLTRVLDQVKLKAIADGTATVAGS